MAYDFAAFIITLTFFKTENYIHSFEQQKGLMPSLQIQNDDAGINEKQDQVSRHIELLARSFSDRFKPQYGLPFQEINALVYYLIVCTVCAIFVVFVW